MSHNACKGTKNPRNLLRFREKKRFFLLEVETIEHVRQGDAALVRAHIEGAEVEALRESLVVLIDGCVVDDTLCDMGTHLIDIDGRIAQAALNAVLGTDVEHVLAQHPLLTAQNLEHEATVVQLVAPHLVNTPIFRFVEGEVIPQ